MKRNYRITCCAGLFGLGLYLTAFGYSARESFDYTPPGASLSGLGDAGVDGWAGSWNGQGGGFGSNHTVADSGLDFSTDADNPTPGVGLAGTSGALSAPSLISRALEKPINVGTLGTTWFSYIAKVNPAVSCTHMFRLGNLTTSLGITISFDEKGTCTVTGIGPSAVTVDSAKVADPSIPFRVIAKVYANMGQCELNIVTIPTSEVFNFDEPVMDPRDAIFFDSLDTYDGVSFQLTGKQLVIDEIYIGTSWRDIRPNNVQPSETDPRVYEKFDKYPEGRIPDSDANNPYDGGYNWADAWLGKSNAFINELPFVAQYPGNVPDDSTNGLHFIGGSYALAMRSMNYTIDLDSDSDVYYVSFLVSTATGVNRLSFNMDNGTAIIDSSLLSLLPPMYRSLLIQYMYDRLANEAVTVPTLSVVFNTNNANFRLGSKDQDQIGTLLLRLADAQSIATYFVVIRLDPKADPTKVGISMSAFIPGDPALDPDTEPTTWGATTESSDRVVLNTMYFANSTVETYVQQIRVGETWKQVVPHADALAAAAKAGRKAVAKNKASSKASARTSAKASARTPVKAGFGQAQATSQNRGTRK